MFGSKKKQPTQDNNALARRLVRGDDSPTESLQNQAEAATTIINDPSEAPTRQLGTKDSDQSAAPNRPVAVLMIIDGPGKGSLLAVGFGMNTVGRGSDQRIAMDFGDELISRQDHARLVYDHQGQRFYLQHGGGHALTYLNGDPVLDPAILHDGAIIRLGATTMLFRTLLGADFDWHTQALNATEP